MSTKTAKSKTAKKVAKPKVKKSSGGTKIAGKAVVALDVRQKKKVHMEVTKVCEHKLSSGRSMFRLAGHTTDGSKNKLSLIVSKDNAKLAEKAIGGKIVKCTTHKVVKKKKSPKTKSTKKA